MNKTERVELKMVPVNQEVDDFMKFYFPQHKTGLQLNTPTKKTINQIIEYLNKKWNSPEFEGHTFFFDNLPLGVDRVSDLLTFVTTDGSIILLYSHTRVAEWIRERQEQGPSWDAPPSLELVQPFSPLLTPIPTQPYAPLPTSTPMTRSHIPPTTTLTRVNDAVHSSTKVSTTSIEGSSSFVLGERSRPSRYRPRQPRLANTDESLDARVTTNTISTESSSESPPRKRPRSYLILQIRDEMFRSIEPIINEESVRITDSLEKRGIVGWDAHEINNLRKTIARHSKFYDALDMFTRQLQRS